MSRLVSKSTLRQYLAGFCCSLAILCSSTTFSWMAPLLVRAVVDADCLRNATNCGNATDPDPDMLLMTSDQSSWVVSLIELGNVLTPIPSGFIVNWTGRKWIALITAPVFFLTWLVVLSTRSVPVLYAVRIVQGMAIGFTFTGVPMYLAEIAEPRLRGSLSTYTGVMWGVGVLYQFCFGPFLSYQTYTLITLLPLILYTGTFIWFPQSPYFLLMRGKTAEAAKALAWFRGASKPEDVSEELNRMKQSVYEEAENRVTWRDIFSTRAGRKGMAVLQLLAVLKIMTGGYLMLSYASQALSKMGEDSRPVAPHTGSIIMSLLTILVTVGSGFIVDSWGRRPLLLFSSLASSLCTCFAFAYYLSESVMLSEGRSPPAWLAYCSFASIIICASVTSVGLGTVSFALRAELFPSRTRGIAIGITSTVITFVSFIALKMHQVISDGVGLYLDFLIYCVFGLVGSVLIYLFVPETKGKTLEEIQKMLR